MTTEVIEEWAVMGIEKELAEIAKLKEGNDEIALFKLDGYWLFYLGNPSGFVMLGEVPGEIVTEGATIQEVIEKMKIKLTSVNQG